MLRDLRDGGVSSEWDGVGWGGGGGLEGQEGRGGAEARADFSHVERFFQHLDGEVTTYAINQENAVRCSLSALFNLEFH